MKRALFVLAGACAAALLFLAPPFDFDGAQAAEQPPASHLHGQFNELNLIHIPLYLNSAGFESTLLLNNSDSSDVEIHVSAYGKTGRVVELPPVELAAFSPGRIELSDVLPSDDEFSAGSLQIGFSGQPLTVTAQLTASSQSLRASFEVREARRFQFETSELRGLVYAPQRETIAAAALTNASERPASVEVALSGHESFASRLTLPPRGTEIVQLWRLAPPGSSDLSRGAVLKVSHDGVPGDVLASGFAIDPRNGSSTGFDFHDPASAVSSRRAAAGIRLGAAGADGGFPPETRFSAPLLLANVSDADLSVELAHRASAEGGLRVAEETVTLQAGEIRTVELSGLLERAGLQGSPAAGLDLVFDGEPSALLARLSVVDSSGYYAFDVPLTDPEGSTGTGNDAYAWRIDRDHSSFVYLKNVLDEPVNALVQVRFEGGTYNPDRIRLEPFETVVLDLEEMRASGEPDIRGNPFPPGVEAGQIEWHEETPGSLVGRGEIFDRATGAAASYACQSNCCGLVRDSGWMSPSSAVDVVGAAGQIFTPFERRKNPCTGALFGPYDMTADSFFSSSDASIATAGSGGWINCIAPGSAGISAQHDSIVGYGQGCVTIVAAITVGATLSVNPRIDGVSGPGFVPLDQSGQGGVQRSIELTASVTPAGGAFSWSVVSGTNKVSLSNTDQAMVTVTSVGESLTQNDVKIRLNYSVNGESADPWEGFLSVIRPKSLTRLTGQETFSSNGKSCPGGGTSYLRTLKYQINSQLSGVAFSGFDSWLEESFSGLEDSPGDCAPRDGQGNIIVAQEPGDLQQSLGQISDEFSFCGADCSGGCELSGQQTIQVNGFVVRINIVTWNCTDVSVQPASGSP